VNFFVTLSAPPVISSSARRLPEARWFPDAPHDRNSFDLTGPIARGDWSTVDAHLAAIHAEVPDLEPLYRALAQATKR
jgi:predicted short-subunit dehydrogenase-like oxidoreductase (DUF2520 family)